MQTPSVPFHLAPDRRERQLHQFNARDEILSPGAVNLTQGHFGGVP
jgi:hypothetical protein